MSESTERQFDQVIEELPVKCPVSRGVVGGP